MSEEQEEFWGLVGLAVFIGLGVLWIFSEIARRLI